jgi:Protein of unknown function (DUF2380)
MLYRSTDRICRCGAPVKNVSHSASFQSFDKNAPLKSGTKQPRQARGAAADAGRNPRLSRRKTLVAPGFVSLAAWGLAAFLIFGPLAVGVCSAATDAPSEPAKSVALLTVQFLNDHEDLEPTTNAERARIALIASVFKAKLEASGRYAFVPISADAAAKISAGPEVGACGGCEFGYGKEFGADTVAWIVIQKVSDLILNINVYMADVAARKMAFVHSVDIRGDTDESWTRGITYLVKNYLLPAP